MILYYNNSMEVRIQEVRSEKNISLIRLSELSGIPKSTLNDYENGKTSPTLVNLEILARALNVRISDLFDSMYK